MDDEKLIFTDFRQSHRGFSEKLELRKLPEYKTQKRKVTHSTYSLNDKRICGADTETLQGKIWLFSTEFGVWEVRTISELIEVMFNHHHSYRYSRKRGKKLQKAVTTKNFFFYNLKFDAQAILKTLDEADIRHLLDNDKLTIFINAFDKEMELEISYLEGKHLQFKPKDFTIDGYKLSPVDCWDISQFYNKMRLQKAGEIYIGKGKQEVCFDGTKLDVSRLEEIITVEDMKTGIVRKIPYREYYRKDIESYAILDAQLCGQLSRLKKKQFNDAGVRFIQPYSLANVAQKHLLENYEIPSLNEYVYASGDYNSKSNWLLRFAYSAYTGGWFEVAGQGYFEGVSAYDLASAYPYAMYHLDDCSEGRWLIHNCPDLLRKKLNEVRPMQLGFVEAIFRFPKDNLWNPLTRKSKMKTLISPTKIHGIFTLDEIKEALLWNPEFVAFGEWAIFYPETDKKPFREFIDKFYEIKMTADKKSADYAVSKIMLNSIYGKTIQAIKDKAGKMFNPIYASVITAYTRVRLAEFMRVNKQKVLSLATDGIVLSTKKAVIPPNHLPACFNLGNWENEVPDGVDLDLVCIQSGVYSLIDSDTKKKYKHTFRGSASYFLREFDNCRDFLIKNSEENKIEKSVYKPYSIKESKVKKDFALVNIFALRSYSISVIGDSTKRIREGNEPQNFGELLNQWFYSKPHKSNLLHDSLAELMESEPKNEIKIIYSRDDAEFDIDLDDDPTF